MAILKPDSTSNSKPLVGSTPTINVSSIEGSANATVRALSSDPDGNLLFTDISPLTVYSFYEIIFQGTVSGYTSGGYSPTVSSTLSTIEKFPFSSDTNATSVGDLTQARSRMTGQSSSDNGYTSGGLPAPTPPFGGSIIEKFPFSSDANAVGVGDLTVDKYDMAGQSSDYNGYVSGGQTPSIINTIEKFPFNSDTNATDIADLTIARYGGSGQSSTTHGYTSGGYYDRDIIDRFPFSSDANASDVGELTSIKIRASGQSSRTHGYSSGGYFSPTNTAINVIEKFSFAASSNGADVGDLTTAKWNMSGQSSVTNGYAAGGRISTPVYTAIIEKFPFASDTNATNIGSLTQVKSTEAGHQI
jgi:hypothetical protein